jgi:hypothetical protein
LKIKLKGRHFDTTVVIENTITEHDFQDKNDKSAGNSAYAQNEITSRMIVAGRPKVSFLLDGSSSPGNYGWAFVLISTRPRDNG